MQHDLTQSPSNRFSALDEDSELESVEKLLLSGVPEEAQNAPSSEEVGQAYGQESGEGTADEASDAANEASDSRYKLKNPIVWMDLEMTGLDPMTDHIMEIAVLITDGELSGPHLEGPDLIIHLPDEVLDGMGEWCATTHGKSGLTQQCRESTISLQQAEDEVLAFIQRHTQTMEVPGSALHKAHLAGNSIYVDRAFLQRRMPRVHAHLHWRLIDVSTLLELARRWFPNEFKRQPKKRVLHKAMADIRESLNELKYYRRTIFKQPGVQYQDYLAAMQAGHGSGPRARRRGRR